MTHPPLKTYSARKIPQGGFTLVEILVVIAIIALLAGVALPAVTGALKKAKENAALQQGHGLALACFQFSNDNDGNFPGTTTTPAVTVAKSEDAFKLLAGTYVSNPDSFYIAMTGKNKYSGTTPSQDLGAANVSWDYTAGAGGVGLTTSDPDQTPLIMSTGATSYSMGTVGTAGAATATLAAAGAGNPFTVDGIAVGYKDMSSAFKTPGSIQTGSAFPISSVSFTPLATYTPLTP